MNKKYLAIFAFIAATTIAVIWATFVLSHQDPKAPAFNLLEEYKRLIKPSGDLDEQK